MVGDQVHSGAGMEPGHLVDDPEGGVRAHGGLSPIGGDGEDVGGSVQSAHGHPTTVRRKRQILHLKHRISY